MMYIMVDLDASSAFTTCLNALAMLETRLGRREETELSDSEVRSIENTSRIVDDL